MASSSVCVYFQELFRFGGVYCGATGTIPFTVTNKVCGLRYLTLRIIPRLSCVLANIKFIGDSGP